MNAPTKFTTLQEVAQLAGVSVHTVERVIAGSPLVGEAIRGKVKQVIAETGFAPEHKVRNVSLKHNALIALIHGADCAEAIAEAEAGVLAALSGSGLALCRLPLDSNARSAVRSFGDLLEVHRPLCVLLMPSLASDDRLAGLAWEYGSRCVRLGAKAPDDGQAGWSFCLEREAAAQAVHWLAELGHSRIAFIGGSDDDPASRERQLGYLDAMADRELDRGASLIVQGDGSFASSHDAALLLLEVSPAPTAILAASDEMAAGALRAAAQLGIVIPDALSIIGFGDGPLALQMTPALSSVRVPMFEMARGAAMWMLKGDGGSGSPLMFHGLIIERQTTGPPS